MEKNVDVDDVIKILNIHTTLTLYSGYLGAATAAPLILGRIIALIAGYQDRCCDLSGSTF